MPAEPLGNGNSSPIDPQEPLVSVVMAVLNPHPSHFRQAVASILNQTHRNLEVILVEDPSERDGREITREFNDPRIVHIRNEERTHIRNQLNAGLELAKSEFVARADADDVFEPNRVELQLARFQSDPDLDVLGSNLRIIDDQNNEIGFREYPLEHDEIVQALRFYNPLAQPAVMLRMDKVRILGGYCIEYYVEDYDLWCRLAAMGAKFANLPQPLLRYRVHPEGMKSAKLKRQLVASIRVKEEHFGDSMSFREKIRLLAEKTLLYLPSKLVLWLFSKTTYSKKMRRNPEAATSR